MTARMRYAYICINYNNTRFTVDAVESLLAATTPPTRIIVVDNASRPEERAALQDLQRRRPIVETVLSDDNSGYFPGLNKGLDVLRASDNFEQWVVIGNNDLIFPSDFGEKLATTVRHHAGDPVISPNVVTLDGVRQNPHVISGLSRPREFMFDLYYSNYWLGQFIKWAAGATSRLTDRDDEQQHDVAQYIYQGHGSVYILGPKFFEEFGQLDAPTFMMGEEFFLSEQLKRKGYRVWYEPRIEVQHCCNGAIRSVPSKQMWERAKEAHRVYRRYVKPWKRQG